MKIAVLGNEFRSVGATLAALLAYRQHEVAFAVFHYAVESSSIADSSKVTIASGAFGSQASEPTCIPLRGCGTEWVKSLDGAEIIFMDVPLSELVDRLEKVEPYIPRGAIVFFQSYAGWAAARAAAFLGACGRSDLRVCEGDAPSVAGRWMNGSLHSVIERKRLSVAALPVVNAQDVIRMVAEILPATVAASSVLETGLGNINLLVHPAMTLLGIALFESAEAGSGELMFYKQANTPSAGKLSDALDSERAAVCKAYDVPFRSLPETVREMYGATGANSYDVVQSCAPYQNIPPMKADIWKDWMREDVPFGLVPLVLLAEQAGVKVPLHRGIADVVSCLLDIEPWGGVDLASLGLEGNPADVRRRVTSN